jgi:hypothetical protein
MARKHTKWAENIPNGHKIDQNYQFRGLQNLGLLVCKFIIRQPWRVPSIWVNCYKMPFKPFFATVSWPVVDEKESTFIKRSQYWIPDSWTSLLVYVLNLKWFDTLAASLTLIERLLGTYVLVKAVESRNRVGLPWCPGKKRAIIIMNDERDYFKTLSTEN